MNHMKHKPDTNSEKLRKWLGRRPAPNRKRLLGLLDQQGHSKYGITHALRGADFAGLRRHIVKELKLK